MSKLNRDNRFYIAVREIQSHIEDAVGEEDKRYLPFTSIDVFYRKDNKEVKYTFSLTKESLKELVSSVEDDTFTDLKILLYNEKSRNDETRYSVEWRIDGEFAQSIIEFIISEYQDNPLRDLFEECLSSAYITPALIFSTNNDGRGYTTHFKIGDPSRPGSMNLSEFAQKSDPYFFLSLLGFLELCKDVVYVKKDAWKSYGYTAVPFDKTRSLLLKLFELSKTTESEPLNLWG